MVKKYEVQFVVIERSYYYTFAKDFFRAYDNDDDEGMKTAAHEMYANNTDVCEYQWESFDTLEDATKRAKEFAECRTFTNCGMRFVDIMVGEVYEMTYDDNGDLDEGTFLDAYEI